MLKLRKIMLKYLDGIFETTTFVVDEEGIFFFHYYNTII
jgi:hypothetical protein